MALPKSSESNPLHALLLSSRRYHFKKGQVVHSSDGRTAVTLVESGFVMRYEITNSGTMSIQSIYGKGTVYPLTLVFKLLFDQTIYSGPETIYYETMADSVLYVIDSETFLKKVNDNHEIYRDLLKESAKRFNSNIQQLENISLPSSLQRVAHQLLYFASQFGEAKGRTDSIVITLPLTHALLASTLNLTRETVSQSISELRKLGLIKAERQTVIVPDIKRLEHFAYQ